MCYIINVFSIDATEEDGRIGRLISHSKDNANVAVKLISSSHRPHLCMIAKTAISSGQELLYDYGDHSVSSIEAFPWLNS